MGRTSKSRLQEQGVTTKYIGNLINIKVCDEREAGTDRDVKITIKLGNGKKCTTKALDRPWPKNDWGRGEEYIGIYCGRKFLGSCFNQRIQYHCNPRSCTGPPISITTHTTFWYKLKDNVKP